MGFLPKVDVLLPVGSDDIYLDLAIDSIRKSKDIEPRILLIDNTLNGLPKIRSKLSTRDLVFREEARGFAHAINSPLQRGHQFADFVALMNSDDISHPERLVLQINKLRATNTELNLCSVQNFRKNQKVNPFFGEINYSKYSPILLNLGAYGLEPTWVSRADWWERHSYRNPNIHPDIVDLECALKSFYRSRISSLSQKLYFYRKHPKQMSRKSAHLSDFIKISETIENFFKHTGIKYPGMQTYYLARPHNIFKDMTTFSDRNRVLEYLNDVYLALVSLSFDDSMLREISELIQIRQISQSKIRSLARLSQLQMFRYMKNEIKTTF